MQQSGQKRVRRWAKHVLCFNELVAIGHEFGCSVLQWGPIVRLWCSGDIAFVQSFCVPWVKYTKTQTPVTCPITLVKVPLYTTEFCGLGTSTFCHWDSAVKFHCAKHDRNSCETQWPCWDLNTQTMRKMSLGPSGAHQDVTFSGAPRTYKHRAAVLFYVWPAINDSTCAQTAASVQAIGSIWAGQIIPTLLGFV